MVRHVADRLNRHTGGNAAHHRQFSRVNAFNGQGGAGRVNPVALNDARGKARFFHRFGQFHNFQCPGTMGQAADEAAFFQCRDQPVDA